MTESDKKDFITMLSATLDIYGRKLSPGAYSIWFECMRQWPLDQCRAAFSKYVQCGKSNAPVPADIVKVLQADDGWIEAEQAWAIVAKTMNDERVTVFWTPPMQRAFGAAMELQDDMVAARMAFKEVYNRELAEARSTGEGPTWQMSPGTDPTMRTAAIREALRLGRIALPYAKAILPPQQQGALPDGLEIKRIEGHA